MTDEFLDELRLLLAIPTLDLIPPGGQAAPGCRLYAVPGAAWQVQLPSDCKARQAFQICALLKAHARHREREASLSSQLEQLSRELDALVNVSQLTEDETSLGEGILPDQDGIRWAVLKNGKPLIVKGLPQHAVVPSARRLQDEAEFSYVVASGEHWALRVGRFAAICESDQRISPLMRQFIRLRLEWLNRSLREREMAERMQNLLCSHREDLERLQRDAESSRYSAMELHQRLDHLHREFEGTLRQATTDSLTHAYNRAKIDEVLAGFCQRAAEMPPFCLLALDVDCFKQVNDTHGHLTGDRVLIEVVSAIRGVLRQTDVLARWGGDEFLVLLPESELATATACGERLRRAVSLIPSNSHLKVSISVGVIMHRHDECPDALFKRADAALYEAKRNGRNRVVVRD